MSELGGGGGKGGARREGGVGGWVGDELEANQISQEALSKAGCNLFPVSCVIAPNVFLKKSMVRSHQSRALHSKHFKGVRGLQGF